MVEHSRPLQNIVEHQTPREQQVVSPVRGGKARRSSASACEYATTPAACSRRDRESHLSRRSPRVHSGTSSIARQQFGGKPFERGYCSSCVHWACLLSRSSHAAQHALGMPRAREYTSTWRTVCKYARRALVCLSLPTCPACVLNPSFTLVPAGPGIFSRRPSSPYPYTSSPAAAITQVSPEDKQRSAAQPSPSLRQEDATASLPNSRRPSAVQQRRNGPIHAAHSRLLTVDEDQSIPWVHAAGQCSRPTLDEALNVDEQPTGTGVDALAKLDADLQGRVQGKAVSGGTGWSR